MLVHYRSSFCGSFFCLYKVPSLQPAVICELCTAWHCTSRSTFFFRQTDRKEWRESSSRPPRLLGISSNWLICLAPTQIHIHIHITLITYSGNFSTDSILARLQWIPKDFNKFRLFLIFLSLIQFKFVHIS